MPTFIESFCTNNDRYKANQKLTPVGVILHSIGCPQPDASVLHKSWANNKSQYMTHYVLDDEKIIHCMPNDRKCYHVGSPGNGKWLGIEMCEPAQIKYKSGATFTVTDAGKAKAYTKKCYDNAVLLLAMLCKQYGWNPYTAILTHNEVTRQKLSNTNHVDPEHLWKGLAMGYTLDGLRKDVAAAMGQDDNQIQTESHTAPSANTKETRYTMTMRTLKNGCKGEDVRALQIMLRYHGYNLGTSGDKKDGVDGDFGAKTETAVRMYQKANNLGVDGKAGPATMGSLLGV